MGLVRSATRPILVGCSLRASRGTPDRIDLRDYEAWLHGDVQDVIRLQFREPPPSDDFRILQTMDRWQSRVPPTKPFPRRGNMLM
jgi:hypothetical protein